MSDQTTYFQLIATCPVTIGEAVADEIRAISGLEPVLFEAVNQPTATLETVFEDDVAARLAHEVDGQPLVGLHVHIGLAADQLADHRHALLRQRRLEAAQAVDAAQRRVETRLQPLFGKRQRTRHRLAEPRRIGDGVAGGQRGVAASGGAGLR